MTAPDAKSAGASPAARPATSPGTSPGAVEARYRRLLRWYPRGWRERNAEVVLGALLDAAERDGRFSPTGRERADAAIAGLAARLSPAFALGAAYAALATAVLSGAAWVWGFAPDAAAILSVLVGPLFAVASLIASLRVRAYVSDARALALLGLAPAALVGALLARTAFSLSFDAADEGVAATGLGAVWIPVFAFAWAVGAAAFGTLFHALFRRSGLGRAASIVLGLLAGGGAALFVGVALVWPVFGAAAAVLALLIAFSVQPRAAASDAPLSSAMIAPPSREVHEQSSAVFAPSSPDAHAESIAGSSSLPGEVHAQSGVQPQSGVHPQRGVQPQSIVRDDRPGRRSARLLAWVSAAGSLVGIAYALTGSLWWAGGPDSTVAMGWGISFSLLCGLPLLGAVALMAQVRGRRGPHVAGPLTLVALAIGAVIAAYLAAPSWDGMAPGFIVGALLTGAALAWALVRVMPGSMPVRVTSGVLVGAAYASFVGTLIMPMLAFGVAPAAAAFAIWGTRSPRRERGVTAGRTHSPRDPASGSSTPAMDPTSGRRA